MPIDRRSLIGAGLGLSLASAAGAQDWGSPTPAEGAPDRPVWPPEHFKLWPQGKIPGAPATLPTPRNTMNGPAANRQFWLYGIPEPIVAVYRPPNPDGRALLTIPGGGYSFVSVQKEGIGVAKTYTAEGITVFVLAYRLPGEGWTPRWDVPLQDGQRAMRLIRARAATWAINPDKLGVVGFSAGGHLAGSLATSFEDKVYAAVDAADTQSARPAFAGLIYPVINPMFGASGDTFKNLLGSNPDPAISARYTIDKRVTAATPPVFLAHAMNDGLVDPGNSIAMLAACRAAKVPVEAHLYEKGNHGFGTDNIVAEARSARRWPENFSDWMTMHA
ncbi:alpha/beta hydrolase [Hephaestia sp. GCM10023244]|uniref:alpha/beta hydrolase n=1 Tax=unclassified Hephaestia TaxID=2631281 RepID=UPI00207763BB|nr:alpha/beta hydrolase [Hephaestia sp. MAHUQ-44]MCM8731306.1 alpha/beta hydrolase [Hephaestia sp. MAHUQ-44]